ncbi:hypothetical protein I4U23_008269 [Adineta vaga]|nr:hypothetical protein I4U23_008269 [Adineta vaga]
MTQLNHFSHVNCHLFTLFVVILICLNQHQISANRLSSKSDYEQRSLVYDDTSDEDLGNNDYPIMNTRNNAYLTDYEEPSSSKPWSNLFRQYQQKSIYTPAYYSSPKSGFALRRSDLRYIPYLSAKRSIPIELQKALFAHGIVGRRR